ncbi:hypothetical protein [Sediminispirochaeta bajacaliforniensis]|uniref:hypothetical protein n=1 Tax=Sediminispirochaeta bajacaliforniensis TaxID=148 RepID=UPI0003630C3B|nr:hypothetical protein [Sediminispirochaeta bajacaliforniensis]
MKRWQGSLGAVACRRGRLFGHGLIIATLFMVVAMPIIAEPVFSGILTTTLDTVAGAGKASDFSYGSEQYANVRMRSSLGDRAVVQAAVNLIAATGSGAETLLYSNDQAESSTDDENYVAKLELERLYAQIRGEVTDIELGLMRVAFGYGQAFRPTDFLNPPNPLLPDARPRGSLGGTLAFYPSDLTKILFFSAGGVDPLETAGDGLLFGASGENHWSNVSVQLLYSFQAPDEDYWMGFHRSGVSLKLDTAVGIVLDALYGFDPADPEGWSGLEAALGLDASFFDGDLYTIVQYLFNGPGYLGHSQSIRELDTAELNAEELSDYNRRNYLYAQGIYSLDDYTRINFSLLFTPDDFSCSPAMGFEYEPFQGCTLAMTGRLSLDGEFLSSGERGELGPIFAGTYGSVHTTFTLRF